MTSDHQPLTDTDLSAIRGAVERADLIEEETLPLAFTDRKRLLAEVDRLRTELETKSVVHECCEAAVELKKDRAHCKGLLADAERGEQEALAEAARLRAENTTQAERLAEVRELRRTWFQNADVVRGKADSIRGLTEVERAELRQAAAEMQRCARQIGLALGPTPEESPDFMLKDLDRRAALGIDQDGEANG